MYDMLLQVFDWMDRSPFAAFLASWILLSVLLVPLWGRVTRRPSVRGGRRGLVGNWDRDGKRRGIDGEWY